MSKILAIKGHSTRGKEVIELLKMMGGETIAAKGDDETAIYVIPVNGIIDVRYAYKKRIDNYAIFTLEEFLEKFPFKVGDFVRIPEYESEVRILKMKWCPLSEYIEYLVYPNDEEEWFTAEELLEDNDNPNKTRDCKKCGLHFGSVRCFDKDCPHNTPKSYAVGLKDGKVIECGVNKEIVMNEIKPLFKTGDVVKLKGCPDKNIFWIVMDVVKDGYIFNDGIKYSFDDQHHYEKTNREVINPMKNVLAELFEHIKTTPKEELELEFEEIKEWSNVGPTVEEFMDFCNRVNEKPKYPTTYEECCEIKHCNPDFYVDTHLYSDTLSLLYKLLICRDAYWKIAGEELELGEPWKPKFGKYILYSIKFYLFQDSFVLYKGEYNCSDNCILVFPSEEMRDTFYENFKDLIEQCKKLL